MKGAARSFLHIKAKRYGLVYAFYYFLCLAVKHAKIFKRAQNAVHIGICQRLLFKHFLFLLILFIER